nr:class I tRNA ligase family protein [Peribacillus acanthi]
MRTDVNQLYVTTGSYIEKAHLKRAIGTVFDAIRKANKYFDSRQPWIQIKEAPNECEDTLATCVYSILNFARLLHPFLPFSSQKVIEMVGVTSISWRPIEVYETTLQKVHPLFERIDVSSIDIEIERLNDQGN